MHGSAALVLPWYARSFTAYATSGPHFCAAKHRFDNLYGEDAARPDRGTRIREKLVHIDNPLTKIASWMVFGVNKRITTEMDSVYVDDMVYTMHWRKFMRKTTDSWRDSRLQSIALIM